MGLDMNDGEAKAGKRERETYTVRVELYVFWVSRKCMNIMYDGIELNLCVCVVT